MGSARIIADWFGAVARISNGCPRRRCSFFVGFNLILFTKRLFLSDYLIAYTGFLIATTSALIVGKVVLVADKLPLLARFDDEPLAYPILFKSVVDTALVFVARVLEAFVHFHRRRPRNRRWAIHSA